MQYDGDVEQSSSKKGGLRATVDGDAKRNRRHSSDESGGSVTELDTSRYLRSYQQASPMQPGKLSIAHTTHYWFDNCVGNNNT